MDNSYSTNMTDLYKSNIRDLVEARESALSAREEIEALIARATALWITWKLTTDLNKYMNDRFDPAVRYADEHMMFGRAQRRGAPTNG